MDELLKEFELLSLPSRVNFDVIGDDCIDKSLEKFDYNYVFEALKKKGSSASPFQWRKLREACLISKPLNYEFMVDVYEQSILFTIRKSEFAECHIAMSKLTEFYSLKGFQTDFLCIIILFKFYYCGDFDDGMSEISSFLRLQLESKMIEHEKVQSALTVCRLASQRNYWQLSKMKHEFYNDELIIVDLISERVKKDFIHFALKSYALVPVSWISELLGLDSSKDDAKFVQEEILKLCDIEVPLNEGRDRFVLKRQKNK